MEELQELQREPWPSLQSPGWSGMLSEEGRGKVARVGKKVPKEKVERAEKKVLKEKVARVEKRERKERKEESNSTAQ